MCSPFCVPLAGRYKGHSVLRAMFACPQNTLVLSGKGEMLKTPRYGRELSWKPLCLPARVPSNQSIWQYPGEEYPMASAYWDSASGIQMGTSGRFLPGSLPKRRPHTESDYQNMQNIKEATGKNVTLKYPLLPVLFFVPSGSHYVARAGQELCTD